jgi:hypothetical protein
MNVSVAEKICWGVVRSGTYVHDGDGLLARRAEVLDHVLDQHGALGDLTLCDEESVQCTARKWLGVEDIPVKLSTPRWIYALTARHLTVELEDGELAEELDGLAVAEAVVVDNLLLRSVMKSQYNVRCKSGWEWKTYQ